jgi:hypothetical protein
MRFEVPQFIEVEDKIVGPFTWKQFVYLAGAAGALLVLFFVLPLVLFAFIGIPIAALGGFLAFHKINNRPFSIFLESFVQYFAGQKLYLWKRKNQQTVTHKEETPIVAPTPVSLGKTGNIASLSRKLELNTLEE